MAEKMNLYDNEAERAELTSIEENWKFCKKFLIDLRKRKSESVNTESPVISAIREIEEEMKEIIFPSNGAKPKKRGGYMGKWEGDKSTDETSNEETDKSDRRRRKMKTRKKEAGFDQIELLTSIVRKLDHRSVPHMEDFDETEGMDLERYLDQFEEHCKENYRGRRYFWLTELGRKLSGRTLECYRSIRRVEEDYEAVKDKLLEWYDEEKEIRKAKAVKDFEQARMKSGESVHMFANRLKSLFKMAFPRKNFETSKKLINRFGAAVPKPMKRIIENQLFNMKIADESLTWKKIEKCARVFDLEKGEECRIKSDEEEVVEVNFTEAARREERKEYKNWKNGKEAGKAVMYRDRQRSYDYEGNNQERSRPPANFNGTCNHCGRYGHMVKDCRVKHQQCFSCGKPGHFIRDCTARQEWGGRQIHRRSSYQEDRKDNNTRGHPRRMSVQRNLNM